MANYEYDTAGSGSQKLHIMKTSADNIRLINLVGEKNLDDSIYYGVNGGFFSNHMLNITMNAGGPIGPRITFKNPETGNSEIMVDGRGVIWCGDGVVGWSGAATFSMSGVHFAEDVDKATSMYSWAQGGYSMFLGYSDWEDRLLDECRGYDPQSTWKDSRQRTGIVVDLDTDDVYLIATTGSYTWESFRNAIQEYLRIEDTSGSNRNSHYKGLFLDGGGSTQMVCREVSLNPSGRALHGIIALKDK